MNQGRNEGLGGPCANLLGGPYCYCLTNEYRIIEFVYKMKNIKTNYIFFISRYCH